MGILETLFSFIYTLYQLHLLPWPLLLSRHSNESIFRDTFFSFEIKQVLIDLNAFSQLRPAGTLSTTR